MSFVKNCRCLGSLFVPNFNNLLIFRRSFKSDFKLKWVRPPPLPFHHPSKSGDLKELQPLEYDKFPILYEKSEELKTADPLVQRVFSCGFQGRRVTAQRSLQLLIDSIKTNEFDEESMEFRVARLTHKIRNLKQHLAERPQEVVGKARLKEYIDRRKKLLCELRARDYKKFEWLLDKLDLQFKPHPEGGYIRIERKASVKKLVDAHCNSIRENSIKKYQDYLDGQKEEFLKNKIETLKWCRDEQISCKIEPTVREEDIRHVEKQLEEFLMIFNEKQKLKPVAKVRK